MRGAFFIVILIAMLIAAYLVMKNIESTPDATPGVEKVEVIDKARDVTEEAEKVNNLYQEMVKDAAP